jgi:hypothetical protein
MKNLTVVEQNQPNDCDVLIDKFEHTLLDLENCFDTVVDDKKTKMNVVGSIFRFGKSLTKLTFNVAGCAIKNTPKAVVAVAAVKKEIIDAGEEIFHEGNKELNKLVLDLKIQELARRELK